MKDTATTALTRAQYYSLEWVAKHNGCPPSECRGPNTFGVLATLKLINVEEKGVFITEAGRRLLQGTTTDV